MFFFFNFIICAFFKVPGRFRGVPGGSGWFRAVPGVPGGSGQVPPFTYTQEKERARAGLTSDTSLGFLAFDGNAFSVRSRSKILLNTTDFSLP